MAVRHRVHCSSYNIRCFVGAILFESIGECLVLFLWSFFMVFKVKYFAELGRGDDIS